MPGQLTVIDREKLYACLCEDRDVSWSKMAGRLGRDRTTVMREVTRNGGRDRYSPSVAQTRAAETARRPRVPILEADAKLGVRVVTELEAGFSPVGISKLLAAEGGPTVTHETIYRAVYDGTLGVAPADVLRTRRPGRRRRQGDLTTNPTGNFLGNYRPIGDRPPQVSTRAEPGHWEGDLIVGQGSRSAMITLYERTLRLTHLISLPHGKAAHHVAAALTGWLVGLPPWMRLTLTWDQGSEMARWALIDQLLSSGVFFADKHSPWQRPGNENNNRLIRYWFPKGTDLTVPGPRLHQALHVLNNQPRRSLSWLTPNQAYDHHTRALTA